MSRSKVNLAEGVSYQPLKPTISLFERLMGESYGEKIRFNVMTGKPEWYDETEDVWEEWSDANDASMASYFQSQYGIYNQNMLTQAFTIYMAHHRANPLTQALKALKWDGQHRIENFLHEIMRAEDTPVNKEISRMIFTGGVRRAFCPGCKWDYMVVLVGGQGQGKTTIVQWLAMGYHRAINTFNGKEAMEGLRGVWIGEVEELSAMRKAKDIETVKAFLSRQSDSYREPYTRNVETFPRRCILIGTTNSDKFLSDQTGNRRFFPVRVHSAGRELFENRTAIQEYICQCWAEAVSLFKAGELPEDYDHSIDRELETVRAEAEEDDWKLEAIRGYLDDLPAGTAVCVPMLWIDACRLDREKLTVSEASRIREYMDKQPDWQRGGGRRRFGLFGQVKSYWVSAR